MNAMINFDQMLPTQNYWVAMKAQATELIRSGFLPSAINTPEKAVAIILKGRELGIPPMQALSHIHIINGKPTMSAELMLAQILRLHPHTKISYPTRNDKLCEVKVQRQGSEPSVFSFSIEDAERAGVAAKEIWKKYPRAMLHARAVAEMARALFPDAISGVSYCPEELNAYVDDSGNVLIEPDDKKEEKKEPSNENKTATNTETQVVSSPMDAPKNDSVPNSAASPQAWVMFDRNDKNHLKAILHFVEKKNCGSSFAGLVSQMEGRPFNMANVNEAWDLINPEAPDKGAI